MKFSKFFKEISCFIGVVVSQIRTFRTSILKNNSISFDSEMLLENSVVSFSKEDYAHAMEEVRISKYLIETIIFLRLIVCSIEPLDLSSEAFCKVLEECTIENSSFIFEEKKVDTHILSNDNSLFFSFLGNEMKSNIKKKAIYIEKSDKSQEEGNFNHFTKFYLDIIKMLNECDRRMNQYK